MPIRGRCSNVFGTITRMNSKRSIQTPSSAERRMKRKSPLPASSTRTIRRSSPKSRLGEQHKDQIQQQYQARLDNLDNARYEAESGKISGMQNMVSGVGDAVRATRHALWLRRVRQIGTCRNHGQQLAIWNRKSNRQKPFSPLRMNCNGGSSVPRNRKPYGSKNSNGPQNYTAAAKIRFSPTSRR